MGLQFHETVRGKNFFEYQLPKLIEAIEKLAESKSESNSTYPFALADEETRRRLLDVIEEPEKAEAFASAFYDRFIVDGDSFASLGLNMARAILYNNIEAFLVAVVGLNSKTLLNIAEGDLTNSQEVPTV